MTLGYYGVFVLFGTIFSIILIEVDSTFTPADLKYIIVPLFILGIPVLYKIIKIRNLEKQVSYDIQSFLNKYLEKVLDDEEADSNTVTSATCSLKSIISTVDDLLLLNAGLKGRRFDQDTKLSYMNKIVFSPLINPVRDNLIKISNKLLLSDKDELFLQKVESLLGFDERVPEYSQYISFVKEKSVEKNIIEIAESECKKYANQLHVEYLRMVSMDIYGNKDLTKWDEYGKKYFFEKNIQPIIRSRNISPQYDFKMRQKVFDIITEYAQKKIENDLFRNDFTGVEFEEYCASLIEKNGYSVILTKKSGDQGIDLIVDGMIGIQCKMHSKPVGNSAVQEVLAGLQYYNLNDGFVITNSSYTKSCLSLAEINNIRCIHYHEVGKYFNKNNG